MVTRVRTPEEERLLNKCKGVACIDKEQVLKDILRAKHSIQNLTIKELLDKDILLAISKLSNSVNDIWGMLRIGYIKKIRKSENDEE